MAYYEIMMLVFLVILVALGGKVVYEAGCKTGQDDGYNEGIRIGEELGYPKGYKDGKSEGYRDYRRLEMSLYERDKRRKQEEQLELIQSIQTLNDTRQEEEETVPQEILLAYGVTKLDELPLHVRKTYKVNKTGGVINGEETGE